MGTNKHRLKFNPLYGVFHRGNVMSKFRDWELLDSLPEGWKIDRTAGSPLHGYEFCTNCKSALHPEHKRALVRVIKNNSNPKRISPDVNNEFKQKKNISHEDYIFPARTVNELARQKFKQQILRDILVDLMICEIEGWCKTEYIKEIRSLVNSIAKTKCITLSNDKQLPITLDAQ